MRVETFFESKELGTISISVEAEKHTDPDKLIYLVADTIGEARNQVAQCLWGG